MNLLQLIYKILHPKVNFKKSHKFEIYPIGSRRNGYIFVRWGKNND